MPANGRLKNSARSQGFLKYTHHYLHGTESSWLIVDYLAILRQLQNIEIIDW